MFPVWTWPWDVCILQKCSVIIITTASCWAARGACAGGHRNYLAFEEEDGRRRRRSFSLYWCQLTALMGGAVSNDWHMGWRVTVIESLVSGLVGLVGEGSEPHAMSVTGGTRNTWNHLGVFSVPHHFIYSMEFALIFIQSGFTTSGSMEQRDLFSPLSAFFRTVVYYFPRFYEFRYCNTLTHHWRRHSHS